MSLQGMHFGAGCPEAGPLASRLPRSLKPRSHPASGSLAEQEVHGQAGREALSWTCLLGLTLGHRTVPTPLTSTDSAGMWAHWGTGPMGSTLVPIGHHSLSTPAWCPLGAPQAAELLEVVMETHAGLKAGLAVDSSGLGWVASW